MRALIAGVLVTTAAFTAHADDGLPVSIGVAGGLSAASGPLRTAPAIELTGGVHFDRSWALVAGLGGWTLGSSGSNAGRTEVALSAGAEFRRPISERLMLAVGAAPAALVEDEWGKPFALRAAILVAPSLELATRRRSLTLRVGARGYAVTDGLRFGASAGVVYTFW